jgi:hypothetical protein
VTSVSETVRPRDETKDIQEFTVGATLTLTRGAGEGSCSGDFVPRFRRFQD